MAAFPKRSKGCALAAAVLALQSLANGPRVVAAKQGVVAQICKVDKLDVAFVSAQTHP